MPPRYRKRRRTVGRRSMPARYRGYYRRGGFYNSRAPGRQGGGERKFHDIDVDDASIGTVWAYPNTGTINLIPQNTGSSGRNGRKAVIRAINWRFQIEKGVTATSVLASDTVRVVLYVDRQCNGVTATSALMFASDNFQTFNALENRMRFKILMDRTYQLNSQSSAVVAEFGTVRINDSFYKKCDIPLEFSGTGTPVTDNIKSNNLGVCLISAEAICAFDSKFRLRFTDS